MAVTAGGCRQVRMVGGCREVEVAEVVAGNDGWHRRKRRHTPDQGRLCKR